MSDENRKCQNCEYYQRRQGHQDGICRIRSPQVVMAIDVKGVGMPKTGWPIVQKDDWCGEFLHKTEQTAEAKTSEEIYQSPT